MYSDGILYKKYKSIRGTFKTMATKKNNKNINFYLKNTIS